MGKTVFSKDRIIFFLSSLVIVLVPDLILDLPVWLGLVLFLAVFLIPYVGYAFIFFWCYVAIVVSQSPTTPLSIAFWVLFGIYIVYDIIAIILLIREHHKGKQRLLALRGLIYLIISDALSEPEVDLCEDLIMDSIKTILKPKSRIKEAAGWSDSFDYSKLSYKLLYQVCFSLLSSGRLHLYRGFLSPAGDAVYSLYIHVLQFYEENGMLGNSCLEEQLDIVDGYIAEVG